MAENRKCLYGILNSNTNLQLTIPRMFPVEDGESSMSVYTIPYKDLSALVRDSSEAGSLPLAKETLARLLVGHQTVIERIMAQGATIIPMKFGTSARDENEVKEILMNGYPLMKEIMTKIRDKIEIDVVMTWNHFDAAVRDAGEGKAIREFKARLLNQPQGATVEDRIKIGLMIKNALDEKSAVVSGNVLDRLQTVSEDARIHERMDDRMVMNAAFLIARAKQSAFEETIEKLNVNLRDELNFRCVGPLPPYSFYTLEAKRFLFGEIDGARKKLGLLDVRTTRGEIKKAHKAMAFSCHPDRNPTVPGRENEFDEVTQAFRVLEEYCRKGACSFEEAEFRKAAVWVRIASPPSGMLDRVPAEGRRP